MINFFRRIRKKLADDNMPLKYMRYAIGEIVLVVVGILIALQINNWNEQNTIQENIKAQVGALILDLKRDKLSFAEVRGFHAFRVHSVLYLMEQYGSGKDPVLFAEAGEIPVLSETGLFGGPVPETYDKIFIIRSFSWLLRYIHMTARINTMEEFKNTGLLAHFKNQELKTRILDYYDAVYFTFEGDDRDTNPTEMLKKTFTAKGFAYSEAAVLDQPIEVLLSEPTIRAILINIVDESAYRSNISDRMIEHLEQLIQDLEMENQKR
ncbi:MAG: DUF6090 family protein [Eudoraea sp.]|uniref:DUF6090 family protein n=1 Tax=Eudoraea sp. TaxID=1979955 RepID=UPI003C735C1A